MGTKFRISIIRVIPMNSHSAQSLPSRNGTQSDHPGLKMDHLDANVRSLRKTLTLNVDDETFFSGDGKMMLHPVVTDIMFIPTTFLSNRSRLPSYVPDIRRTVAAGKWQEMPRINVDSTTGVISVLENPIPRCHQIAALISGQGRWSGLGTISAARPTGGIVDMGLQNNLVMPREYVATNQGLLFDPGTVTIRRSVSVKTKKLGALAVGHSKLETQTLCLEHHAIEPLLLLGNTINSVPIRMPGRLIMDHTPSAHMNTQTGFNSLENASPDRNLTTVLNHVRPDLLSFGKFSPSKKNADAATADYALKGIPTSGFIGSTADGERTLVESTMIAEFQTANLIRFSDTYAVTGRLTTQVTGLEDLGFLHDVTGAGVYVQSEFIEIDVPIGFSGALPNMFPVVFLPSAYNDTTAAQTYQMASIVHYVDLPRGTANLIPVGFDDVVFPHNLTLTQFETSLANMGQTMSVAHQFGVDLSLVANFPLN